MLRCFMLFSVQEIRKLMCHVHWLTQSVVDGVGGGLQNLMSLRMPKWLVGPVDIVKFLFKTQIKKKKTSN